MAGLDDLIAIAQQIIAIPVNKYISSRLESIMLLKLSIMLLSSTPKSSPLCSKLCPAI